MTTLLKGAAPLNWALRFRGCSRCHHDLQPHFRRGQNSVRSRRRFFSNRRKKNRRVHLGVTSGWWFAICFGAFVVEKGAFGGAGAVWLLVKKRKEVPVIATVMPRRGGDGKIYWPRSISLLSLSLDFSISRPSTSTPAYVAPPVS